MERQFRLMSIRRLFREEVCSYAYAVQALFDDYLISAVEKMVKPVSARLMLPRLELLLRVIGFACFVATGEQNLALRV